MNITQNVIKYETTSGLTNFLHRESYMSAHVLLNLLNKLRKRYKMRGCPRRV